MNLPLYAASFSEPDIVYSYVVLIILGESDCHLKLGIILLSE